MIVPSGRLLQLPPFAAEQIIINANFVKLKYRNPEVVGFGPFLLPS